MDDDRVTLNAGGRIFETTALTLKTSGAGYFEALLGETGSKLPGRKRARVSEDGDDAPGRREIFIDRDPDVFADVLRYMRTSRLPAAAAADVHQLADLKLEAEFLAYDALLNACEAAEALASPPEETAESKMFFVNPHANEPDRWGEEVRIGVPKGQVLVITQVTPTPTNNALDWILRAESKNELGVIAQYNACTLPEDRQSQLEFLQRDMNLVLEGGDDEVVAFDSNGAEWSVLCWIGHPSKIPGL